MKMLRSAITYADKLFIGNPGEAHQNFLERHSLPFAEIISLRGFVISENKFLDRKAAMDDLPTYWRYINMEDKISPAHPTARYIGKGELESRGYEEARNVDSNL